MPPETLAVDPASLEQSGGAAHEVALPINGILGQLPSGKVEISVEELVQHVPPGYLRPANEIAGFLPTLVSLPLMDVVMRIPPDLLALRPDQKEVDAAVVNMADPFTEEVLREQAEAARRQSGANIIDESQAPQEEFVPSQPTPVKSVAPPRRPAVEPLLQSRTAATTLAAPSVPATKVSPSLSTSAQRNFGPPLPPSTAPTPMPTLPGARTPTGQIPTPVRMSAPLPPRQTASIPFAAPPAAVTSQAAAPVPPVPRHTGPIPAPPPPRHTTSIPTVPRRTGTLASLSQSLTGAARAAAAAAAVSGAESLIETKPPAPPSPAPVSSTDDLKRLAERAMAEMGESVEEPPAAKEEEFITPPPAPLAPRPSVPTVPVKSFTTPPPLATPAPVVPEPEPEPVVEAKAEDPEPTPEPVAVVPEPEPVAVEPEPEPIAVAAEPEPAPTAVTPVPEPAPAPEPEPVPVAPEPEPAAAFASHEEAAIDPSTSAVAFNLNTCSAEDLVHHISGISATLAGAIIAYRTRIGTYSKLEELLAVPGMTREAYTNLTGEAPPETRTNLSLNELLGFPVEKELAFKDVTDRILCWPDVTGCVLSGDDGLPMVGHAAAGFTEDAISAIAPKMFGSLNDTFSQVAGFETDILVIPSAGTSFHLFRSRNLYLTIMSRLPLMPERHVKVARLALTALSERKE